ncbi:ABC transporter ATP-binding protein [Nocardioides lentus]|uniref:ABC transporter ATP-binding protein n=1 Tax=Nocardioides lentus TaxID=338077 RepID=A0ABP5A5W6_9ACTN
MSQPGTTAGGTPGGRYGRTRPAPPLPPPGPRPTTGDALVRRTLARQWRRVLGAATLASSWQVCEAMVPVLIGVVVDRAVATGDVGAVVGWALALCLLFVVLSFSYRFGAFVAFRAMQEETHRVRGEISAHVLDERGARTGRLPGEVLALATGDAEAVATVVRQLVFTAAGVVGLVASAVVLVRIDPLIALVVLLGVPAVLAVTQLLAPRLARRSAAAQAAVADTTGVATDLVRGVRPLRGIRAEDVVLGRYRRSSRAAADAGVAAARSEGLVYGVATGLSGLFLAGVALLAGARALDGQLSIGELVAVVGLAQFFAEPVQLLTRLVAELARARASAGRVVDLLATPPLVTGGLLDPPGTGAPEVVLDDVSVATLRGVTLRAAPGALTAVVTEDPADAAALGALLRGETPPAAGALRLDGTPLADLTLVGRRERLLLVPHHVDLLEGTLRSNVDPQGRLGADELGAVLAASAADDVVDLDPAGLDQPVAADGTTLSGGQRQRLALARALAADAPGLVLHDPTTAVDAVTEHRIAEGLVALRHPRTPGPTGPRTTLVLTSSPALLARADLVVHLRGGEVAATGTHADLLDDPAYAAAVLR